jgi:hypothetical protein
VTHLNQSESSSNKIQNFGSCDLANKQHIPIKIQSLNLTVPRENPSEKPNGKPKLKIQMESPFDTATVVIFNTVMQLQLLGQKW